MFEMRVGHGGWLKISDAELPGALYLRVAEDDRGRWRTAAIYFEGEWRSILSADLRELNLTAFEELASANADLVRATLHVPSPQLGVLASSFQTRPGPGAWGGRHCEACGAPLRRQSPPADGKEHWTDEWVLLAYLSQLPKSGVPKLSTDDFGHRPPDVTPTESAPLRRPTEGLTDDFLEHVRDAYNDATLRGEAPAPALARQVGDGATPRTIHKWVSIARQRGIMPPASQGQRVSGGPRG